MDLLRRRHSGWCHARAHRVYEALKLHQPGYLVEPGATELPCPRDRSTRERSRFDGADVADGPTVSIAVGSPAAELIRRVGAVLNEVIQVFRSAPVQTALRRSLGCLRVAQSTHGQIVHHRPGFQAAARHPQIIGNSPRLENFDRPVTEDVVPCDCNVTMGSQSELKNALSVGGTRFSARMVFLIRMAGETKSACEIPPPPVHGVKGHTDKKMSPSTLFCTRVTFSKYRRHSGNDFRERRARTVKATAECACAIGCQGRIL